MSDDENQFIKLIKAKFDTKLSSTSEVESFPLEIQSLLKKLYSENGLTPRLTATLLNGAFTEGREIFLMSQPLMLSLIRIDNLNKNIERESLNDEEYRTFVKCIRERKIIEVTDDSEKFSYNFPKGKAATWKLCDRYILNLLNSILPKELDDDGCPYLDLSAEEMQLQWVGGGHRDSYNQWLNKQIAAEIQKEPRQEGSKFSKVSSVSQEALKKILEIEKRKNGQFKFN